MTDSGCRNCGGTGWTLHPSWSGKGDERYEPCECDRRTTPPPAAEEREAVARAISTKTFAYCIGGSGDCGDWEEMDTRATDIYLNAADAALLALAPIRAAEILAAEARGYAMAVEDAANEARQLWEYGIPAQEFPRRIRAIERNEHGAGK